MSEQVWSEWFEHKPGECPIPWAKGGEWQSEGCYTPELGAGCYAGFWPNQTVSYRYRLDCAPAGFVPPGAEKPWCPPQQPGFGPWVENTAGTLPLQGERFCILMRCDRDLKRWTEDDCSRDCGVYWDLCGLQGDIVAYAVCLEDQPTAAEVEATQEPWSLEQDAADYASDTELQNRPMCDGDDIGLLTGTWDRFNARHAWQKPTAAPAFMVRDVRSSDGLLTVREADHRMGGWQS